MIWRSSFQKHNIVYNIPFIKKFEKKFQKITIFLHIVQADSQDIEESYILIRLVCACVCLTRQFCCIQWQNRPLHFLWQNRPLYNFGAAGCGGGETHASHRSRLSVRQSVCLYLTLTYFKLPWGERNKDVIK